VKNTKGMCRLKITKEEGSEGVSVGKEVWKNYTNPLETGGIRRVTAVLGWDKNP